MYSASQQPLLYSSTALIDVGGVQYDPNPDLGNIRTAFELAGVYAATALTNENLQGTIDTLDLDWSLSRLESALIIYSYLEAPIIAVEAVTNDRELSAAIANAMAEQIVKNNPNNLSSAEQVQLQTNAEQIELLDSQVGTLSARLDTLDAQIAQFDADQDRDAVVILQQERTTISGQLAQFSQIIADLKADNTRIRSRTNTLDIYETALPARSAASRGVANQAVLGAFAGAGFAICLIAILEYLNTSIRSSEQAVQALGVPVLGTIARFGKKNAHPRDLLITKQTHSLVLEGYRTLHTNLLFSSAGDKLKGVFLITSAKDGEGKSTTAVNLAAAMALSGLSVLLIDADLHRPKIHHFFDLDNSVGLSTLLTSGTDSTYPDGKPVPESVATAALLRCVQTTSIPNLTVITSGTGDGGGSGSLTQVSSGVFLLQRFKDWLDVYRKTREVDIVIFDTPPSLVAVDSSILAATTEADVILVIQTGRTKRDDAQRVKGQFVHIGRDVRGVVMNKTPRSEVDHGYGYGYYDDLQTLSVRPSTMQPDMTTTQATRPQKV
jgi:Mrp family chromosome partitioning ATPase